MTDDVVRTARSYADDDESFVGQIGYIFGAMTIAALLLAAGAFFALGGIRMLAWVARLLF